MDIFKKILSIGKKIGPTGPVEYIVAGLGNPGTKYENTRHNAGFIAVDCICKSYGLELTQNSKFNAMSGTLNISGKKILIIKPQTFMNLSGDSVKKAMSFYKIPPQKTIILLDDISLPLGKIRIKSCGSHAGQNGMRNIIDLCSSNEFPRIKIGVGQKPSPEWDLANWVLSNFNESERVIIDNAAKKTKEALNCMIKFGIQKAMNDYN